MAEKEIAAVVKFKFRQDSLACTPVGTALGPHGIAIMDFAKSTMQRLRINADK